MVDVARARKLAVRIREVVSMTLETQVKDPRLGMVTITDAKVTPTCARPRSTTRSTAATRSGRAARSRSSRPRACCGAPSASRPGVRYTPSLQFIADVVPETAGKIEDLLAQARAEDARVSSIAERARPAGDADPYRVPRAPELDDDPDDGSDGPDDEPDGALDGSRL
jgi:ribosome-binding factor A